MPGRARAEREHGSPDLVERICGETIGFLRGEVPVRGLARLQQLSGLPGKRQAQMLVQLLGKVMVVVAVRVPNLLDDAEDTLEPIKLRRQVSRSSAVRP
jgi:hypothetical protein